MIYMVRKERNRNKDVLSRQIKEFANAISKTLFVESDNGSGRNSIPPVEELRQRFQSLHQSWKDEIIWTTETEAVHARTLEQLHYLSDAEGVDLFFEKVKKSVKLHNARGTCLTENAHKEFLHTFRGRPDFFFSLLAPLLLLT